MQGFEAVLSIATCVGGLARASPDVLAGNLTLLSSRGIHLTLAGTNRHDITIPYTVYLTLTFGFG